MAVSSTYLYSIGSRLSASDIYYYCGQYYQLSIPVTLLSNVIAHDYSGRGYKVSESEFDIVVLINTMVVDYFHVNVNMDKKFYKRENSIAPENEIQLVDY